MGSRELSGPGGLAIGGGLLCVGEGGVAAGWCVEWCANFCGGWAALRRYGVLVCRPIFAQSRVLCQLVVKKGTTSNYARLYPMLVLGSYFATTWAPGAWGG